jgi:lipoprotein-releasing system ATP-binding protein
MDSMTQTQQHQSQEAMAADDLLKAVEISKSFTNGHPPLQVLDRLTLSLKKRETLAVVGASGIGKSTLLHILGTLDRPDQGALYFKGEDVFQYNDGQLARFRNRTIGFVFQFHHLLPEFTTLENAMMPAIIQGMGKSSARAAAEAVLGRVGLSDRLHQKATQLSGGEQQRVALARAVALNPSILLADEPTGNLDKDNSEQIHQLLTELNEQMGTAIIVVTHNMALASIMQRQATIVDGKLEYQQPK